MIHRLKVLFILGAIQSRSMVEDLTAIAYAVECGRGLSARYHVQLSAVSAVVGGRIRREKLIGSQRHPCANDNQVISAVTCLLPNTIKNNSVGRDQQQFTTVFIVSSTMVQLNADFGKSQRARLTCIQCHRRKIKCDKNIPCQTCSKR